MSCTQNVDKDRTFDNTPLSSLRGSSHTYANITNETLSNEDLLALDQQESWMMPETKCLCETEAFDLQDSAADPPTHLKSSKDFSSEISSENYKEDNNIPDDGDFIKANNTSDSAVECLRTLFKDEMCRSSSLAQRFQVEHSNGIPAQEYIFNTSNSACEQACCNNATYCDSFTASKATKRCMSECTFPTAVMGSCIKSDKRTLLTSMGPQEKCGCFRVEKLALAILNATDSASDAANKSDHVDVCPSKEECCCINCSKVKHESLTGVLSQDIKESVSYTECLVVFPGDSRKRSSSVELSNSCSSCAKYLVPPNENFSVKSSSCEVSDGAYSNMSCNQHFPYCDDSKEDLRMVCRQQMNKIMDVNNRTESVRDITDTEIDSDRYDASDTSMHCNKSEAIEKLINLNDTPYPTLDTEDIESESQKLCYCDKEFSNILSVSKVDIDDEFQIYPGYFAPLTGEPYDPLASAISFDNLIEDQVPSRNGINNDMEVTQHPYCNFCNNSYVKPEMDDYYESEDEDHVGTYYSKVETRYCKSHNNSEIMDNKMFHSTGESVLSVSTACTVHVEITNEKNSSASHTSHSGFTYRQITRMDKADSDLEESMTAFIQSNMHQSVPLEDTPEEAERKELSNAINETDINSTRAILNTPCDSGDTLGVQNTSTESYFQHEPEIRVTQKSKSDTKQNEIPDNNSNSQPKFQRKLPNILRNRNKYFPRDNFFKPRNNFMMGRMEYSIHAQGDMLPFELGKQPAANKMPTRIWNVLWRFYESTLNLQLILLVFLQLAQAILSYYSKDVEWELSTSGMVFRSQSVLYRMYRHYTRVRPYTAIFAIHMGYSPAALLISALTAVLFLLGPSYPTAFVAGLTIMMYTLSVDVFDIVTTVVAVAPHLGIEFALHFVAMSVVITFTQLILWYGGYKYYNLLTRAP